MPHRGAAGPDKNPHGAGRTVQIPHPWDNIETYISHK